MYNAVCKYGEQQGNAQGDYCNQNRKYRGDFEGVEVVSIAQQLAKVLQTDEGGGQPEWVFQMKGLPQRLPGGEKEKDQRDRQLWSDQQVGQKLMAEDDA